MNALTCKWCEKTFSRESTLAAHMCVRKRRWADRDMTHIRLAYYTYQKFYELNTTSSKTKTMEDFIRSQYYEGFTKFGRACTVNQWLNPEQYAEWLIRNGVKLKDWVTDKTYNTWLLEYVKKETGLRALERTILYLTEWAEENGRDFQDYFHVVTPNRAVYDIRAGKISPWVIYLSDGGTQILKSLSSEQVNMVKDLIDANFWMRVFQKNESEMEAVRETCAAAGL